MSDINAKIATLRSILNDALEDPAEFTVVAEYVSPILSRVGVVLRMEGGSCWLKVFDTHEEREGFIKGFEHAKWASPSPGNIYVCRWECASTHALSELAVSGGIDAPDSTSHNTSPLCALRGERAALLDRFKAICRIADGRRAGVAEEWERDEIMQAHEETRYALRAVDDLIIKALDAGWRDPWWRSNEP